MFFNDVNCTDVSWPGLPTPTRLLFICITRHLCAEVLCIVPIILLFICSIIRNLFCPIPLVCIFHSRKCLFAEFHIILESVSLQNFITLNISVVWYGCKQKSAPSNYERPSTIEKPCATKKTKKSHISYLWCVTANSKLIKSNLSCQMPWMLEFLLKIGLLYPLLLIWNYKEISCSSQKIC